MAVHPGPRRPRIGERQRRAEAVIGICGSQASHGTVSEASAAQAGSGTGQLGRRLPDSSNPQVTARILFPGGAGWRAPARTARPWRASAGMPAVRRKPNRPRVRRRDVPPRGVGPDPPADPAGQLPQAVPPRPPRLLATGQVMPTGRQRGRHEACGIQMSAWPLTPVPQASSRHGPEPRAFTTLQPRPAAAVQARRPSRSASKWSYRNRTGSGGRGTDWLPRVCPGTGRRVAPATEPARWARAPGSSASRRSHREPG